MSERSSGCPPEAAIPLPALYGKKTAFRAVGTGVEWTPRRILAYASRRLPLGPDPRMVVLRRTTDDLVRHTLPASLLLAIAGAANKMKARE